MNLEGRAQRANVVSTRLPQAREDWKIIRALSEVLGVPLPYDDINEVRRRMEDIAPHLAMIDSVEAPWTKDPTAIKSQVYVKLLPW